MKRILIVEDEPELAENIQDILNHMGYEVINILRNADDTLEYLENELPDMILMDILLEGPIDGIDLTYKIRHAYDIPIVFITAYSDQAFLERVSNVANEGYVLKPFSKERLTSSIFLAFKAFESRPVSQKKKATLQLRDKGYMVPVPEDDIILLKADGLYTKVYTKSKQYTIRDILKDVVSRLSEARFVRVHKSYIINISFVKSMNSKEVIVENETVPIRRGFYKELKKLLVGFKENPL